VTNMHLMLATEG